METYEILPNGTIIEYKLYNDAVGEIRRKGNIVKFDENIGKYHVGDKIGKKWTTYGFYWIHPSDVRNVVTE